MDTGDKPNQALEFHKILPNSIMNKSQTDQILDKYIKNHVINNLPMSTQNKSSNPNMLSLKNYSTL